MLVSKQTTLKVAAFATICFLLSGCQLFTAGQKKLHAYCPGLKVKVDGVNWSGGSAHDIYVLQYDRSDQKKVNAYFADKANGFAVDKPRSYMDIKNGDTQAVADGDSILTKTVNKGKITATIIYNATTRRIIIAEDY